MRAREQAATYGGDVTRLGNEDLLGLILGMVAARELVRRHGDVLTALADLPAGALWDVPRLGPKKYAALQAVFELARRMLVENRMVGTSDPVRGSGDAANVLRGWFAGAAQEKFVVMALNGRHKVVDLRAVAVGTATSVEVHPREVFAPALQARAAALIVAHAHPSGNCEPSSEDVALTKRIARAGEVLGVTMLDHLIFGKDGEFVSMAERGEI